MDEFRYGLTLMPLQAGDCNAQAMAAHNFGDSFFTANDVPATDVNEA
jgi:evolved beta-galactosidase subunit alpha